MNKKRLAFVTTVVAIVALVLTVYNFSSAATYYGEQTFTDNTFYEGVVNFFKKGVKIGQQGVGGVTYFNGSMANSTTTNGKDNPLTLADNVRIDGAIYRTEEGGSNPLKFADSVVPTKDASYSLGTSAAKFKHGFFSGTVTADAITVSHFNGDGVILNASLADGAVSSAKIADGTIATADLANSAVTDTKLASDSVGAAQIQSNAVTNAKVADDAVGRAEINGTGNANLPIAYGFCDTDGTLEAAYSTDNVSSTWSAANSRYEITITDEDYYFSHYATIITPTTADRIPAANSVLGKLLVTFVNGAGTTGQQSYFSFVVFKR